MFPPDPADKSMQFFGGVCWDLVRFEFAPSGNHLLGGKPDTQVHELDASAAVRPPYETELLDGEKNKSPYRLFCLQFHIFSCAHVASLVWWRTKVGRPLSREGSADFGTNLPPEAHN